MLYTAKPLERVYADPSVFNRSHKKNQKNVSEDKTSDPTSTDEYREVVLPNGRIVTRREGEKYVIEKINSTDMKDYLNEDYYPGKNIPR